MRILYSLTVILLFPLLSKAYTWQFTSPPRQCSNVTVSIEGTGGQPPYSLLILPNGPSPFANKTEVRTIRTIPFPGTSTTLSFDLNYPENSSFVAVVSDKSGFGTGGASTPITVLQSSNSSCYNPSNPIRQAWDFFIDPNGGLVQCETLRLWWEGPLVNGSVSFYGVIPGGTSFPISQGSLSTSFINNDKGTGFNWTVNIAGNTNVLLIGNDESKIGAGGVAGFIIANDVNNSCLNSNSPSSTAGNPAGGYPTGSSVSSSNGSGSHSSSNTGAIVGGVIGGIIFLVSIGMVVVWFILRRSHFTISRRRPVNVLQEDDEDRNEGYHPYLPSQYVPEPYVIPDPTTRETLEASSTHDGPLLMSTFPTDAQRPQTYMTPTTRTRKGTSPQVSAVNIIQHYDVGPSNDDLSGQVELQTIELPPAYSNTRRPQRSPLVSITPTTAEGDLL